MDDGHDGPVEANGADESFDGPQGSSGPIRRAVSFPGVPYDEGASSSHYLLILTYLNLV